jgi:hypothetical protein
MREIYEIHEKKLDNNLLALPIRVLREKVVSRLGLRTSNTSRTRNTWQTRKREEEVFVLAEVVNFEILLFLNS